MIAQDQIGALYPIDLGTTSRRARAKQAVIDLLSEPDPVTGRLVPFWGYQPADRVEGPVSSPTRGGASHQVDLLNPLPWLLFGDELALRNALSRGGDLLSRGAEMDNGHAQLWLSALWTVLLQADRRKAALDALGCYARFTRSRIASLGFSGVRPEVRWMGGAWAWAHWLEAISRAGLLTPDDWRGIQRPAALRARALEVLEAWHEPRKRFFGDGTGRGFIGDPGNWIRQWIDIAADPWKAWAYYTSDSDGSIGATVVAFHHLSLWAVELYRAEVYMGARGKRIPTGFRARAKDVADWILRLAFDPRGGPHCQMKAGKYTFRPSVFTGESPVSTTDARHAEGLFKDWPQDIRTARGENQYPLVASLRMASGAPSSRLELLRLVSVTNKETWRRGGLPEEILWAAAERLS